VVSSRYLKSTVILGPGTCMKKYRGIRYRNLFEKVPYGTRYGTLKNQQLFKGVGRKTFRGCLTEKRSKNNRKIPKNSTIKPLPGEGRMGQRKKTKNNKKTEK